MTATQQAEMILAKMQAITDKTTFSDTDKEIVLDLPPQYTPNWESYIGKALNIGSLVSHKGIKYLVMQPVTPIESQTPDMPDMLAIYKPYQGKYDYTWVYGEYSEIGFTRYFEGKKYEAIQEPNANIYSPDQVPAIWSEIEN